MSVRTCRVCGCTDAAACILRSGRACYWVSPDLCSGCWRRPTKDAILCGPKPPTKRDLAAIEKFATFLAERGPAKAG